MFRHGWGRKKGNCCKTQQQNLLQTQQIPSLLGEENLPIQSCGFPSVQSPVASPDYLERLQERRLKSMEM